MLMWKRLFATFLWYDCDKITATCFSCQITFRWNHIFQTNFVSRRIKSNITTFLWYAQQYLWQKAKTAFWMIYTISCGTFISFYTK